MYNFWPFILFLFALTFSLVVLVCWGVYRVFVNARCDDAKPAPSPRGKLEEIEMVTIAVAVALLIVVLFYVSKTAYAAWITPNGCVRIDLPAEAAVRLSDGRYLVCDSRYPESNKGLLSVRAPHSFAIRGIIFHPASARFDAVALHHADGIGTDSPTIDSMAISPNDYVLARRLALAFRIYPVVAVLEDGTIVILGENSVELLERHDLKPRLLTVHVQSPQTATCLSDHEVFVTDDSGNGIQLNVQTEQIEKNCKLVVHGRHAGSAVLLSSGQVLIAGGEDLATGVGIDTLEVYDPKSNVCQTLDKLRAVRVKPVLIPLADGVMIAGGRLPDRASGEELLREFFWEPWPIRRIDAEYHRF